ncbi:hypothetical protein V1514DRAFT_323358 [Lipomyces japonicus]|uniref:uncharacterized protein n=1 Tax=Lipomyces japonicus TaxID=56871 RepID=UPI0034CFCF15
MRYRHFLTIINSMILGRNLGSHSAQLRRSLSTQTVKSVLPSKKFVTNLGRTHSPVYSYNEVVKDITYITNNTISDKELKKLFGDGRKLINYFRLIERGVMDDIGRTDLANAETMRSCLKTIFKLALRLNNQYALAMKCARDLQASKDDDHDDARHRALTILETLSEANLPSAFFFLAEHYAQQKNFTKAIEEYEKCMQAAQAHVDASQKVDLEFYDYDREVDFSYIARTNFRLGVLYFTKGDLLKMRNHCVTALEQVDFSKEVMIQFERESCDLLAVLARREGNLSAMEYYASRSAMKGSLLSFRLMADFMNQTDPDPRWAMLWRQGSLIKERITAGKPVVIQTPHFKALNIDPNDPLK